MTFIEWIGWSLTLVGLLFFLAGTIGMLRFPDVYMRLHALTKADNIGLGFIVVSLILLHASWLLALKLILVWFLTLLASTVACHLISGLALQQGHKPVEK